MTAIRDLKVKVFADGANQEGIAQLADQPFIKGFTTNPTLMRAAGVEDYEQFAREVLKTVPDLPVSFEVLSDDFAEMERQALKIAAWGDNVYVKIPVTNCRGESAGPLLERLVEYGIHLNVTALMTSAQVQTVAARIGAGPHAFVSLFAGRIADTGRDPLPVVREALAILAPYPSLELIWASPREVLNVFQADEVGCHVITVTHDLLRKLPVVGKDLDDFSLETVQMFFNDAQAAGYAI